MSTSNWYWSWVNSKEATLKASESVPQSGGTIYTYRAPERGQLSASQLKNSIDSISTNINQQWSLWNSHIRPILDSLPSGKRDQRWRSGKGLQDKIDALTYGIQGTTLFVFNDASATKAYGRYWEVTDERPKTIAESLEDIWQAISDIEVGTSTTSGSVDLSPVWSALGNSYNGGTDASGSVSYRTSVVEDQQTELAHDLYSTDAGLGFGSFGWPQHGVAEFIHYLAILHGVASGWDGGNPALVSHGSGYVLGPVSAVDSTIAIYDGVTGAVIKNSLASINASGSINIPTGQTYKINGTALSTANITTPLTGFLYGNGSSIGTLAIPVPSTITVADSTSTGCYVALFESATGNLAPKTDAGIRYNASTGALSSTLFAANTITANTALVPDTSDGAAIGTTALQFSDLFLALGAVINFDNGASTLTHSVGNLAIGGSVATSLTVSGSIGATGTRVTKGWFTDLEVTNAIAGSITGNAATVSVLDTTDATCFVGLFESATGSLAAKTDGGLLYNASTGLLSSTLFAGASRITLGAVSGLTGIIELLGNVSGIVNITASDTTANWTLTLPPNDGTAGQILTTDGSGLCTWETVGAGTATSITIANETADETCFPMFVLNSIPGDYAPRSNPDLKYNALTNILSSARLAATNKITLGAASGTTGSVEFVGTTSGVVTVKSADAAGTWTMTLPTDDGSSGQYLSTNGSGITSWVSASAPLAHALIDSVGHTVSGLTTGHFLKATGATTYDFGAHGLTASDVGAVADGAALLLDQTYPQSIINGFPSFDWGFMLGLTPTTGDHDTGKVFWDTTSKTMAIDLEDDVTLQVGQENHVYVYNDSGVLIADGEAVYITGASGGIPTIAKAIANDFAKSYVLGVVTSTTIASGSYGYVTTFGHINNLDTSAFEVGDLLYLSASTAGELTNVQTSGANYDVKIAQVITKNGGAGKIFVNIKQMERLGDLSDVSVSSPAVDEVIRFNGVEWVNGAPATSSASAGIEFFPDATDIIAKTADNSFPLKTLNKYPVTTTETVDTISCASNTVLGMAYLYDMALNRTSLDAGNWSFDFYLSVSSTLSGRVSTLTKNIYKVSPYTSPTVTITGGPGTSRTCNASSGTPFAAANIDASATNTEASFVRTPKGVYQITARASDTEVTILVPAAYVNETTVAFSVWKKLFGATSPTITNLTTNYGSYSTNSSQGAHAVAATDKLGMVVFATSNNTTDVNYVYNGSARYSHFSTPLITLHNNLAGLYGGSSNNYYHITSTQYSELTGGGDTSLHTHSGLGYVVGPASATDNAIAVYNSTTGKIIKDSLTTIDATYGHLTFPGVNPTEPCRLGKFVAVFDGVNNPITEWGWNWQNGAVVTGGVSAIATMMESHYNWVGHGTYSEWYVTTSDAAGKTIRPLSFIVDNATVDTLLSAGMNISTTGNFEITRTSDSGQLFNFGGGGLLTVKAGISFSSAAAYVQGTTNDPMGLLCYGKYVWVSNLRDGLDFGSAQDTNLYRSAANTLKTDDEFISVGNLTSNTGLILGLDATGGTPNTAGTMKLFSAGDNTFYSTFTAGTQTANATYTLPLAPPTVDGMALTSTTTGTMSWSTILAGDSEDGMTVYKNIYDDFTVVYKSTSTIEVFGLPFNITAVQIKKITRKPTGSAVSVVKNRGTDLVCTWTDDGSIQGKGLITTTSLGTLADTDEYIVEIEGPPKGYVQSVDANKTYEVNSVMAINDGLIGSLGSADTIEVVKSLLVDGFNAISLVVSIGALGDNVKVYGTNDPSGAVGFYDITTLACGVPQIVASGAYQTPGVIMFPYLKFVIAQVGEGEVTTSAYLTRFLKK
jgi:hypothetical protein